MKDITKMPIIGTVTTKEIKYIVTDDKGKKSDYLLPKETYSVVEIEEKNDKKFYITNIWHKEYKKVPLVIAEDIVEKYEPIAENGKIVCHNCSWSWEYKDAGDDVYVCHKCNTDNSKYYKNGGKVLLAPNGKPSNLTPEQYKLVRTQEFKAWFGDWENSPETASKVVDENGEPLVVWHTTNKEFYVFDKKKSKEGFFFSPNKSRLSVYNKSKINSYFLNLRNPSHEIFKLDLKYLKSKDYDGIMDYGHAKHLGNKNLYEIIAFEPNQIKLADGTNTTFDANNPDIRFNDGGNIEVKYYIVYKNQKPLFRTKFGEYNKETERDMINKLDEIADLSYELRPVSFEEYRTFDYSKINMDDLKEFMQKMNYYEEGGYLHGSKYDFCNTGFKLNKEKGQGESLWGRGLYFTKDRNLANYYAKFIQSPNVREMLEQKVADKLGFKTYSDIPYEYENKRIKTKYGQYLKFDLYNQYLKQYVDKSKELGYIYKVTLFPDKENYRIIDFSGTDYNLEENKKRDKEDFKILIDTLTKNKKKYVNQIKKYFDDRGWDFDKAKYISDYNYVLKGLKNDYINFEKYSLSTPLLYNIAYDLKSLFKPDYYKFYNKTNFTDFSNKYNALSADEKEKIRTEERDEQGKNLTEFFKDAGYSGLIYHFSPNLIPYIDNDEYDSDAIVVFDEKDVEIDNCEIAAKGKSLSKTPAPKSERIYGSAKNKPGTSASSKNNIVLSDKVIESIQKIIGESSKKIPLSTAKAVVRRGMGAYSSTHRPTISGGKPNSRVAWGLARLKAFVYKIKHGKSKSGKYKQDDDLIRELGYRVKPYENGGGILLAPNGKPSNLTPEQYKLVRSEEFKKWFGDWENSPETASKVVDENGEPLVVYHGTNSDFTVFEKSTRGAFGKGFYFTQDLKEAKGYGKKLLKVFVNMKKSATPQQVQDIMLSIEDYRYLEGIVVSKIITEKLIKSDFDGVIFEYPNKDKFVVALNPTQIKLADGSNTTFDGSNPDIRFKKGGNIGFEHTLKEVYPNIFLLEMTSQNDLANTFARCQAFYEWDAFRGKKFNLQEYFDWYSVNHPDLKPYQEEFYGFNVPSDVIYDCYKINDERNQYDNFFLEIIDNIKEKTNNFYLIGVVKGDEMTLNHELAHGFFWADKSYRDDMTELVNSLPNKKELFDILSKERGYGDNVLIDEAQAFLSTGLIINITDWEKYRKPFIERFNKQKHNNIQFIKHSVINDFQSGSSLDFYQDLIFVVGDDAKDIVILDKDFNEVNRVNVFQSETKRIPKDVKYDLETSTIVDIDGVPNLLILGSGAKQEFRSVGYLIPLNTKTIINEPFKYNTFVRRLKEETDIKEINIEGCTSLPNKFILSNRGNKSNPDNLLIITENMFWENQENVPISISRILIPDKDAAVSEIYYEKETDSLFFTASIEHTTNAIDDGNIGDSFLGYIKDISSKIDKNTVEVDYFKNLVELSDVFVKQKIEGICIEESNENYFIINLVSDNDNEESSIFKIKLKKWQ